MSYDSPSFGDQLSDDSSSLSDLNLFEFERFLNRLDSTGFGALDFTKSLGVFNFSGGGGFSACSFLFLSNSNDFGNMLGGFGQFR